jgi:hypothetical protein
MMRGVQLPLTKATIVTGLTKTMLLLLLLPTLSVAFRYLHSRNVVHGDLVSAKLLSQQH